MTSRRLDAGIFCLPLLNLDPIICSPLLIPSTKTTQTRFRFRLRLLFYWVKSALTACRSPLKAMPSVLDPFPLVVAPNFLLFEAGLSIYCKSRICTRYLKASFRNELSLQTEVCLHVQFCSDLLSSAGIFERYCETLIFIHLIIYYL